jgi:tetratricopeptide (TPR) repeat protein
MAHHALGMLDAVARLPLDTRIANALVSYIRYLGKTFWPSRLAVFYPYPTVFPMWELVMCGLLLLVISGLVLGMARSRPWLLVGWFWFLGVLVPFSGLVQAGAQSMADRFMYVPAIGIFVAMLWELHGLTKGGRYLQLALTVAAGAALVLCLALTRQQIGYWKDSESLFRHALEATGNNPIALRGLGVALGTKGRMDEAIRQFQEGVRSQPEDADARHNLGVALFKQGQLDEASRQFQEAIRLNPDSVDTHYDLGAALHQQGHIEEAIRQFEEAIHLKPDYADAHNYLGIAVGVKGQMDEAIRQFQEAIRAKPDYAEAHYNLAVALGMKGQTDEAIRELQEALRIKPDYAAARQNLDAALATKAAEAKHGPAATARQRGE